MLPPHAPPPYLVHTPSGEKPPPPAPARSHLGIFIGAALALVGVTALATAGYLVHKSRQGGTEIAYSGKITSWAPPETVTAGATEPAPTATEAQSEVPIPTVTMTAVVGPKPTATVAPIVTAAPASTGGGMVDTSKLMLAVSQAHQAGDGRACLDAFDKLEKDPGYTDPGGYKYMKANCMMMAGRCEDGRKLARLYWQEPRPTMQKMGPVEIENAVSGSAQMYCPTAQLTPEERARRAQMMISKGTTNKDPAAIGKAADDLATALHSYPQTTEEEKRNATSYRYQLVSAYAAANRCSDARTYATQVCAQNSPRNIDACVDGLLANGACKKVAPAATP